MLDRQRRNFLTLLGGAAAAWPLVARTQQRTSVVGILGVASAQGYSTQLFRSTALGRGYQLRKSQRWSPTEDAV